MAVPYSLIPDGDIDPESVIDTPLMTSLRNNPIAIAEGAPGAPRVQRGAIQPGVGHRWFFDYGNQTDGAIIHASDTTIAPGLYQCTTFQINPTYTVGLINKGPLIICATTSIVINGTIDVDGDGGAGALGANVESQNPPGGNGRHGQPGMFGGSGSNGSSGNNGETFGFGGNTFLVGAGGASNSSGLSQPARARATLLSLMPIFNVTKNRVEYSGLSRDDASVGGGGGGGSGNSAFTGGHGGGLVVMVSPSIIVGPNGVITADGTVGAAGDGGGGAIVIATPAGGYVNNGSVSADSLGNGGAGWVDEIIL